METRIWGKANQVAERFLVSDAMRTYQTPPDVWGERKSYTLEYERDEEDNTWLMVTTWGYCYQGLQIPQTYGELVNLKMRAQLGLLDCGHQQIAVRFYFAIMRAVNP